MGVWHQRAGPALEVLRSEESILAERTLKPWKLLSSNSRHEYAAGPGQSSLNSKPHWPVSPARLET